MEAERGNKDGIKTVTMDILKRSSATLRICAGLASLTACALIAAKMVGLLPDRTAAVSQGRVALVESLGVACSVEARHQDLAAIESILSEVARRNDDVNSAGLRLETGELAVDVGGHAARWSFERAGIDQMKVPLMRGDQVWSAVEVGFRPSMVAGTHFDSWPTFSCIVFVALTSFLGHFWYLKRVLRTGDVPPAARESEPQSNDISALERRNADLYRTLSRLEHSREQIRKHNEQLRILASFDPLTGCLNRRSFFEKVDSALRTSNGETCISYLIADVDHFKSINDNYGHSVGDDVLKEIGRMMKERFNCRGSVCRYGGEEFSVLLPGAAIAEAAELADLFRRSLADQPIGDVRVTVSLGVAEFDLTSPEPDSAVEFADRALYAAKRQGRNRVVRWDELAETDFERLGAADQTSERVESVEVSRRIPVNAVSALSAALFHRDAATAEHSRRVAQLCATAARGLLSEKDRYTLEVAALLHDIGKLGIPDEVLHKPGRLTAEEWNVMRTYENIGVVILENAFTCPDLIEILRTYRIYFDGSETTPDAADLGEIPLGGRLLSIADAYDSMLQHRTYRKAFGQDEAFAELRRGAGTQFDPELVEHFISTVQEVRPAPKVDGITPRSALQLGMETEQLACALDAEDRTTLQTMAVRIRQMAQVNGLSEIVELTDAVDNLVNSDADWLELLHTSVELLDTCRVAQWASVGDATTPA